MQVLFSHKHCMLNKQCLYLRLFILRYKRWLLQPVLNAAFTDRYSKLQAVLVRNCSECLQKSGTQAHIGALRLFYSQEWGTGRNGKQGSWQVYIGQTISGANKEIGKCMENRYCGKWGVTGSGVNREFEKWGIRKGRTMQNGKWWRQEICCRECGVD